MKAPYAVQGNEWRSRKTGQRIAFMKVLWSYRYIEEAGKSPELGQYRSYGLQVGRETADGFVLIECIHDVDCRMPACSEHGGNVQPLPAFPSSFSGGCGGQPAVAHRRRNGFMGRLQGLPSN